MAGLRPGGLRIEGLRKVFPDGTVGLEGLDLTVEEGELLVLVGPSGCGKSTLLRLVAGLEAPTAGRIRIGGREVTGLPPQARDVAMVFQNYALYPHLTVAGNLEFPLRMRRMPRRERRRRVAEVAALLGLEGLLGRRPAELSGGQRQRVAMGRALVRRPALLLLDEPLSNLDARLRVQLRAELAALQRRTGVTTVHVTHDQAEAMTLGHRVAVLRAGRLEQVGPPEALYREPATAFVAAFLGSPGMNLLPGRLRREGGGWTLEVAGARWAGGEGPPPAPEGPVAVGVRPEHLSPEPGEAPQPAAALSLAVAAVERLGHETLVHALPPGEAAPAGWGEAVRGAAPPTVALRLPAQARQPAPGETVAVRPSGPLHLFAPAAGERLAAVEPPV